MCGIMFFLGSGKTCIGSQRGGSIPLCILWSTTSLSLSIKEQLMRTYWSGDFNVLDPILYDEPEGKQLIGWVRLIMWSNNQWINENDNNKTSTDRKLKYFLFLFSCYPQKCILLMFCCRVCKISTGMPHNSRSYKFHSIWGHP